VQPLLQLLLRWANRPLSSLVRREEGQGLVEYALIILLVAIAVIGAISLLGTKVGGVFNQITNGL
jgi:pilus assembly protein Flp/PilA